MGGRESKIYKRYDEEQRRHEERGHSHHWQLLATASGNHFSLLDFTSTAILNYLFIYSAHTSSCILDDFIVNRPLDHEQIADPPNNVALTILFVNLGLILISIFLILFSDEATTWALAFAVKTYWVTRHEFEGVVRNYGFRRMSSHLDANACFISGSIVALNLITTLLLATCAILHLPYHSHAQWLLEEGREVMNAAHAAAALNIENSRGSLVSLVISSWVAIFTITLKWCHLHGTPLNSILITAFIIIARATNFRSMACKIRDGGLPRDTPIPVPRSLRAWSRLLQTIQGKGRLLGSDCSICLNQMTGHDEVIVGSCGHAYHSRCLDTWEVAITSQRLVRGSPLPFSSPTSSGIDCGGLWRRQTATQTQTTTSAAGAAIWLRALEDSSSLNLTSCPLCRVSRAGVVLPRRTSI